MSHTAILAIMNNEDKFFNSSINKILNDTTQFIIIVYKLVINIIKFILEKYISTFGHKNHILLLLFTTFIVTISIKIYMITEKLNHLKKQMKIQDGELEFLLYKNVSNEIKIVNIKKQIKKMDKDIKEYI